MLRVLLPVVAGVVLADRLALPLWGVAVGFVLAMVGAWLLRARSRSNVCLFVAFVLLGMLAVEARRGAELSPTEVLRRDEVVAEVAIERVASRNEDVLFCDGRVVACRAIAGGEGESDASPQSKVVNWPVRVAVDSVVGVQMGSRLLVRPRLREYSKQSESLFESYMARRGVVGQLRVARADVVSHLLRDKRLVRRLHEVALRRLRLLDLGEEERAVVEAMAIGDRLSLDAELRQRYARSGAAHLLAVSGLHVGFVFAIINLLLVVVALLRHGQVVRGVVAIVAIWLYAAVAGASPSVVRAAVMFSILQMASMLSARTLALNTLAFTACVMLMWNASLLYDVGFLLSFSAVAGIVVWGRPISRLSALLRRSPRSAPRYERGWRDVAYRVVAYVWHAVAMSAAASVATMPIAAYMFGVVSLWSVVVGPLMILLGMAIVSVAMVWILLPIGFMQGVASWLLDSLTSMLNGIAELCSAHEALVYEGHIGGGVCIACYLLFAGTVLWLWSKEKAA
ncbi:MAG: ComEC/Rec2 family competence protein [Alistipes sp.]|nr:ComEC/Rec2 family competence protein [Alistipes sp.]